MSRMQHFFTGTGSPPFPEVARGDGIYLWDRQGNRYIDGSSGAVNANIGHNNRRVIEAMRLQEDKVCFAYGRVWDSEAQQGLVERLSRAAGWGFDAAFFVSGGTEATEASIKFARQLAWARGERSRWKVISRVPSYHGSTIAVLGVTGDPDFGEVFKPMFVDMPKVRTPLSYRLPEGKSVEEDARDCLAEIEQRIEREGPDTVLALIMEPVGGTATGAAVAPAFYYTGVRQICDRYGVLLLYDEVMSGAGRTGKYLAAHHWQDCRPDIVTLAKGLSGGYAPLGAVLTSSELLEPIRQMGGFIHGHTYAGNPMSCATACAVIDETRDRDLVGNAERMGVLLRERLESLKKTTSIVGDVRGLGLQLAVEIVADQETRTPFDLEAYATEGIKFHCMRHGLVLLSRRFAGGKYGEWLMLTPPLIIDAAQIDDLVNAFEAGLKDFEKQIANRAPPSAARA